MRRSKARSSPHNSGGQEAEGGRAHRHALHRELAPPAREACAPSSTSCGPGSRRGGLRPAPRSGRALPEGVTRSWPPTPSSTPPRGSAPRRLRGPAASLAARPRARARRALPPGEATGRPASPRQRRAARSARATPAGAREMLRWPAPSRRRRAYISSPLGPAIVMRAWEARIACTPSGRRGRRRGAGRSPPRRDPARSSSTTARRASRARRRELSMQARDDALAPSASVSPRGRGCSSLRSPHRPARSGVARRRGGTGGRRGPGHGHQRRPSRVGPEAQRHAGARGHLFRK